MAQSTLIAHCGAQLVTREELDRVPTPAATETWFPLSHATVLDRVTATLGSAGFEVRSTKMALTRGGSRFFGTLDLATPLASGVSLAVGVRNSIDKSLPIAFCAGSRVFVCDNLAFHSEVTVARKHTRNGEARFGEAISLAVQALHQFKVQEGARIKTMQHTSISEDRALALLMRLWEDDVLSHRTLPTALKEWRNSTFEEFREPTLWSLYNAATFALAPRLKSNPQAFAAATLRLGSLLLPSEPVLSTPA